MDGLEMIHTRRSVRQFTATPVSADSVRELLRAAMAAPSAGNQQPWRFVVVRDRALLDAVPRIHPYCGMIREATVAVLVCGDTTAEKYKGLWVQDCSAAVQNLLLAARASGLGAVWTSVYPDQIRVAEFCRLFRLPEHIIPFAIVPIGHSGVEQKRVDRYKDEFVHDNMW